MIDPHQEALFDAKGDSIRPGSMGQVLLADDAREGIKLVELHWGLRPSSGGRPWHNVRAEGRVVPVEERCLVVADGYYITVKEGPDRGRWLVTWPDEPHMCLAGVWQRQRRDWPASYAIITCAPGPDLLSYEDRQSVFVAPSMWGAWLGGAATEKDVLRPLPPGSLKVTRLTRPRSTRRVPARQSDEPLFKF